MPYFLFKTEPDKYSFDDFLRDQETIWDGVNNPTAVMHLRQMSKGTKWIFYHTGDERTAVGTGTVLKAWTPPTPKFPSSKSKWVQALSDIRLKLSPLSKGRNRSSRSLRLIIIGRLSVVPLTEDQWQWFLD